MTFLLPDISSLDNFYDRGKFLLAWRISMSFLFIFIILTTFYGIINPYAAIPAALAGLVAIVSLMYLRVTKNYAPLFWVYATAGSLLANFAMNFVLDFTHFVDFIWLVDVIILAFVGLGWVGGITFSILNVVGVAYFFFGSLNRHIEILQPKTLFEQIADYTEVLFAFFVGSYLMYQFIVFQRYSEKSLTSANQDLASQNKLIQQKNKENETLMKEIHHRVKNNLQIVISLLRMQSAELKSEESKVQFAEAINRIMAMSLIHQKLYGEKELSKVNLKSYLDELISEIVDIFPGQDRVEVKLETQQNAMNLDTIVPLGLLINELISNSFKHAFQGKEDGKISLKIREHEGTFELEYSDDGQWIEPEEGNGSFGLELVEILTDQLNGEKKVTVGNGTHYHFVLRDTIPA